MVRQFQLCQLFARLNDCPHADDGWANARSIGSGAGSTATKLGSTAANTAGTAASMAANATISAASLASGAVRMAYGHVVGDEDQKQVGREAIWGKEH